MIASDLVFIYLDNVSTAKSVVSFADTGFITDLFELFESLIEQCYCFRVIAKPAIDPTQSKIDLAAKLGRKFIFGAGQFILDQYIEGLAISTRIFKSFGKKTTN